MMLKMRADAEMNYANALYRISDRDSNDTIKIGLLKEEVNCFKSSCLSKAKSSEELSINIQQDCYDTLLQLIRQQDEEYEIILEDGKKRI